MMKKLEQKNLLVEPGLENETDVYLLPSAEMGQDERSEPIRLIRSEEEEDVELPLLGDRRVEQEPAERILRSEEEEREEV